MAAGSQSDNFMMRRLVRDTLAARPAAGSRAGDYGPESGTGSKIEDDVTDSIRAIERVVENFHFFKDTVSDLKSRLEEEKAQREELQREVVGLDRALKAERERAARAENAAKTSDAAVRDLEHQLVTLQGQTERLVKAISLLVSAEVDMRGGDLDGSLRLVS